MCYAYSAECSVFLSSPSPIHLLVYSWCITVCCICCWWLSLVPPEGGHLYEIFLRFYRSRKWRKIFRCDFMSVRKVLNFFFLILTARKKEVIFLIIMVYSKHKEQWLIVLIMNLRNHLFNLKMLLHRTVGVGCQLQEWNAKLRLFRGLHGLGQSLGLVAKIMFGLELGSCPVHMTPTKRFIKYLWLFLMIVLSKIETSSELRLSYARDAVCCVESCDSTCGLRNKSRVTVELLANLMWLFENWFKDRIWGVGFGRARNTSTDFLSRW